MGVRPDVVSGVFWVGLARSTDGDGCSQATPSSAAMGAFDNYTIAEQSEGDRLGRVVCVDTLVHPAPRRLDAIVWALFGAR